MLRSFVVTLLVIVPVIALAAGAPKPTSRAEATAVIRELRRVVTPKGVERLASPAPPGATADAQGACRTRVAVFSFTRGGRAP